MSKPLRAAAATIAVVAVEALVLAGCAARPAGGLDRQTVSQAAGRLVDWLRQNNKMASEQAMLALAAWLRLKNGQSALYDYDDE